MLLAFCGNTDMCWRMYPMVKECFLPASNAAAAMLGQAGPSMAVHVPVLHTAFAVDSVLLKHAQACEGSVRCGCG